MSPQVRNSLRLGALLVALTGVNVYVFGFRDGTSVKKLLDPASMSGSVGDQKDEAIADSARAVTGKPKGAGAVRSASAKPQAGVPALDGEAAASAEAPGEGKVDGKIEGKIGPTDALTTVLAREGFGPAAGNVIKALSKLVDPRTIRPGESYAASFDEAGEPDSFEYQPSPALRYIVARDDSGAWQARKEEAALETKIESAAGVVDSSLYDSVHKAGEASALVSLFVDLFAWDLNFYVDTHPGDTWKVVVEKQYLGGQLYKYGRVLAAEYSGRVGAFRVFYWQPTPKAQGRYYDEKGQAVAKTMLKCPLRFVRVSSKFDRARFHPVLHVAKAHLGVDYAAPIGTPVWASAGGKVAEVGMKRGSGNTIVLSHGGGLTTRYYHLSRYAKGLHVGQLVHQKEVIGFVGSTGLSTGPHLHFGVTRNGAFVDPMKLPVAREAPVPDRGAYLAAIRPHATKLKALDSVLARN
jgi:murein DD-endopeptidase MepM/ murein hydrolase activator NlpD